MTKLNGKYYESDYEQAFVELLQQNGWDYTFGEDLHRKVTEPLLEDDLRAFLSYRYADKGLSTTEMDTIIANIKNVSGSTDYIALRNAYLLYSEGYDFVYSDGRGDPFKLEYIDFEHPERNIFRAVNQFEMQQGQQTRIPDVLLFINGIPVCIIELKNPTNENATIRNAHTQITVRYRRDIPSLLKYCVMACISDGSNTRLGNTMAGYEYFYAWKKVENEDKTGSGLQELETLIKGAFAPQRILEILRDYIYFPDLSDTDNELQVVCRYPQFFATRKLRNNIIDHLRSNGGDGKGGVYFGATGCGKTYTMLFLARQLALRCREKLGSPTILLIVDREDLETQAGKLFCKSKTYLNDDAIKVFDSIAELSTEMKLRKSGGFYVTTIQKFTKEMGLLSDRSNIICFSDEAHRTQTGLGSKLKMNSDENKGELGAFISYGFAEYLRRALPNATYVGFTGTPIDETVHVFGAIVDQYTMKESQEDGITVPISYLPRLARVAMDAQQAEQIENYYKLCADEGATSEDIIKSKAAMSSLEVILGDEGRLRRVAQDIIADYETRLTDKPDILQKAMITCSDRKIAYRLYKIIEEYRPEWCKPVKSLNPSAFTTDELEKLHDVAYVNVVATTSKDDPKDMYEYLGDEDHRKFLDSEFKNEKSNFHIAIVVDMWITGFDCPPLTFLYNDKPLQKHTLIQTISRVNRKYKEKECGVIIDYIGIRENMKEAMKKYGGDVAPKEDVELCLEILRNELEILKDLTKDLDFNKFFNENALTRLLFIQEAAEYILANSFKEKGKASFDTLFKGHVRRLRSAYDICSPAGVLTEEDMAWAQCFMGIMSFMSKITSTHHDVESMNRNVEKMVAEAISCNGVESVLDMEGAEDVFGIDFVKELDDVKMPNTKFQLLVKMLKKAIREYSKTNKIQAEKFDKLLGDTIDEYNTRDKLTFTNDVATDTIHAISEAVEEKVASLTDKLLEIFRDLKADKEEFKKLGITFEEKAFYDILVDLRDKHKFEYADERCIALAHKIKELIDGTSLYVDWINNDNLKSQLASDLTMLIYKEGYPPEWDEEVFNRVLEQVENYKRFN